MFDWFVYPTRNDFSKFLRFKKHIQISEPSLYVNTKNVYRDRIISRGTQFPVIIGIRFFVSLQIVSLWKQTRDLNAQQTFQKDVTFVINKQFNKRLH